MMEQLKEAENETDNPEGEMMHSALQSKKTVSAYLLGTAVCIG